MSWPSTASVLMYLLILSLERRYNYLAREREKNLVVSGGRVEGSWKEGGHWLRVHAPWCDPYPHPYTPLSLLM